MRFVELVVNPDEGWSRFGRAAADDQRVTREAIHQLELMDDGSVVMLYELSGDHDTIHDLLVEHFDAKGSEISEVAGNVLVYAHHDPSPTVDGLLRIPRELGVVVDTPLEFTRDGGIRLTLVGDEADIRQAIAAIPESVHHTVERTGEYQPEQERLFAELTDRQQEILLTALEMGYYEQPRRATYEDLAGELGCTKTTVGEHLRKAEEKVLTGIAPD
ncbi:helix-turn-helix domain-containing protein [Haloglomus halophilum]|uniref:helix-turn-helix domain-containing protein n=1 Tax=Haloglomus halophilum TaxID=2962672 RepID=UPI0020C9E6AD|nr:helix-turn-helix domain-containing protein [Haloglomus halophilum]